MTTLKAALQEACFMELEDIPSEEELSTDETLEQFSASGFFICVHHQKL